MIFRFLAGDVVIYNNDSLVELGVGIVTGRRYLEDSIVISYLREDRRICDGSRYGIEDRTRRYFDWSETSLTLLLRKIPRK